jgi:hypothetical protein
VAGRLRRADRGLLFVIAAFAASRVAYFAAGVDFDSTPIGVFWQYIDPDLLRHRLLESLWYSHAQPPLFNLSLGVVLKLFGGSFHTVFQVLFLGLGLALAVLLYRLMRRLAVSTRVSAALAAVYAASPAAVLYENWLYLEEVVAVCLLGAAVALHRLAERRRARDAWIAFALLGAVVLSRPVFHLLWLLGLVGLVWLAQPQRRRVIAVAAAVPVALTLVVYTKNFVMFDTLSSTSCPGINAARVTTFQLSKEEIRRRVREGRLSSFALEDAFGLAATRPELFDRGRRRGIALLDRKIKSTGAPNIDNAAYLQICPRYMEDAKTVLREEPDAFKRAVQQATFIYWRPPSQYAFLPRDNLADTRWIERAYGLVFYGQIHPAKDIEFLALEPRGDYSVRRRIGEVAWLALAAYLVAAAFAVAVLWRAIRARRVTPLALVAAYALFNIAWVTVVGTGFEAGEKNRFRYLVDPLALALVAACLARLRQRASGTAASTTSETSAGARNRLVP